jgi:hypothetical protein
MYTFLLILNVVEVAALVYIIKLIKERIDGGWF